MAKMFGEIKLRDALGAKGPEYLDRKNPTKRSFDVIVSGLMLATLSPAMGGIAVGSTIDTRESSLFPQQRINLSKAPVGEALELIRGLSEEDLPEDLLELYLKFRTMRGKNKITYGVKDPRASKLFGQPLRSSGGDELPQLWGVFGGRMSMVGRRDPLLVDLQDMHDADPIMLQDLRDKLAGSNVKPAVLSPDSLWGHRYPDAEQNAAYWRKRMQLMYEYPENASLLGDIRIMARAPRNIMDAHFHPLGDYVELVPAAADTPEAA